MHNMPGTPRRGHPIRVSSPAGAYMWLLFRSMPPALPCAQGFFVAEETRATSRGLAGKPLAGFRATPSRRIPVLCGMIVYVIRFNNQLLDR